MATAAASYLCPASPGSTRNRLRRTETRAFSGEEEALGGNQSWPPRAGLPELASRSRLLGWTTPSISHLFPSSETALIKDPVQLLHCHSSLETETSLKSALWSRFRGCTCAPGGGGRPPSKPPPPTSTAARGRSATNNRLKVGPARERALPRGLAGLHTQTGRGDKAAKGGLSELQPCGHFRLSLAKKRPSWRNRACSGTFPCERGSAHFPVQPEKVSPGPGPARPGRPAPLTLHAAARPRPLRLQLGFWSRI